MLSLKVKNNPMLIPEIQNLAILSFDVPLIAHVGRRACLLIEDVSCEAGDLCRSSWQAIGFKHCCAAPYLRGGFWLLTALFLCFVDGEVPAR